MRAMNHCSPLKTRHFVQIAHPPEADDPVG